MKNKTITTAYLKELEAEYTSTKKCVEGIPETLYEFKPHPTSMKLEYLTLLVAEIPLWITLTKSRYSFSVTRLENIASSLNHWVHHRGQLTVYMRMNEITVPSIYGPSANDKSYGNLAK